MQMIAIIVAFRVNKPEKSLIRSILTTKKEEVIYESKTLALNKKTKPAITYKGRADSVSPSGNCLKMRESKHLS